MKRILCFLVLIATLFSACKKDNCNPTAAELEQSPEQVTAGNNHLVLNALLYRDFMPGGDAPLDCHDFLFDKDTVALPQTIEMLSQYIIAGDAVYVNSFEGHRSVANWGLYGDIVNSAPKLQPNTVVDVVCEFKVRKSVYRIIDKAVVIGEVH